MRIQTKNPHFDWLSIKRGVCSSGDCDIMLTTSIGCLIRPVNMDAFRIYLIYRSRCLPFSISVMDPATAAGIGLAVMSLASQCFTGAMQGMVIT